MLFEEAKKMKILGIYHNGDNDGKFSAALLDSIYPDIKLVGWNFGKKISVKDIEIEEKTKFDLIIICDLPLLGLIKEFEDLTDLDITNNSGEESNRSVYPYTNIRGYNIFWFDHHIGNITEVLNKGLYNISGLQNTIYSGAMNTYKYYKKVGLIKKEIKALDYIDTYDCWKKVDGPVEWDDALAFNFATRTLNIKDFKDSFINIKSKNIANLILSSALTKGHAIKKSIEEDAEDLRTRMEEVEILDHKINFVNVSNHKSYIGELLNDDEGIICLWSYNGEKYLYSLRTKSDNIDLSLIAKKFGGGGHRQAAGFSSRKPIH